MNFLAFEASTRHISVALCCAGEIRAIGGDAPNDGSTKLLPWAQQLLAAAQISMKQLDGVAFGAGPGAFTGLRLACGLAQGVACALDAPLAPVASTAVLALGAGDGRRLVCLDARMNEIYLAAYEVAGDAVVEVMAPLAAPAATAALPAQGEWRGAGDGFAIAGDVLQQRMGSRLLAVAADLYPQARDLARLAAPVLACGGGVTAAQAAPLYVRDKVALTSAERRARGALR